MNQQSRGSKASYNMTYISYTIVVKLAHGVDFLGGSHINGKERKKFSVCVFI
jgi:hypothetical protein